jgi:hypothetical protein
MNQNPTLWWYNNLMFNKIFKNNFAKVTNEDMVLNIDKLRDYEGMEVCGTHPENNSVCVKINSNRGLERRKFERFVKDNWEGNVTICEDGCIEVSK